MKLRNKQLKEGLRKLNLIEKQQLIQLLQLSNSNGMSRYYLAYERNSTKDLKSNPLK